MNNTLHDLLVISDLDNTLLTARNEIPQANRDMIRLFCARGGRFTVASGRSVTSVQAALAGVPLSAPVIWGAVSSTSISIISLSRLPLAS